MGDVIENGAVLGQIYTNLLLGSPTLAGKNNFQIYMYFNTSILTRGVK